MALLPRSSPRLPRLERIHSEPATVSDRPLITIAIPSYQRPELLRQALASIAAQRDFTDYEVVVCDDGGRPETREVVASCRIRNLRFHVNTPPLGAVGNWNRCIEQAAGSWVTILHEDDILYPWFLRTVADHLDEDVAAVAVRCVLGETPPRLTSPSAVTRVVPYAPRWFLKSSMTPFPGVVFSRAIARRIGGFDPEESGIADYAFWYGLVCAGPVLVVQANAAFYRVHADQWTAREWPRMLRRAHLLRLRIAREQFGAGSAAGRWLARFYSARMARAYARRFGESPLTLTRVRRFERIPFRRLPSGWVWAWLKRFGGAPSAESSLTFADRHHVAASAGSE